MTKKVTISDFIAKDRKDMPFEERAKKFEEAIKPLCDEWGIVPWAGLQTTNELIGAVPQLKDTWANHELSTDKSA